MTLGSTQPLTGISTTLFLGHKERPEHKAHNFIAIFFANCLENIGASTSHNPMGIHGL
jgi:hypothetical protein